MRVIIAGSRSITEYHLVERAVANSEFQITTILSGGARGVDSLAIEYANKNGMAQEIYPADWFTLGKKAGYVRNLKMSENADALIAIWDGKSKGTKHMIDIMKDKQLPVYVEIIQ